MSPPSSKAKAKYRRLFRRLLFFCGVAAFLTGFNSIGYYRQAISGQYEILAKREPIAEVITRTNTPPSLREKLQLVLGIREFAEHELHLETDGHYSSYADLGRRYVVWNVYAAPEFSLEPKKWWYPVVGSLKYRGFFSEKDAQHCAEGLAKEGYDVYIGGVDAYSTLGFFKDPVLNTFIHNGPPELAEILFHELAHQRVFAKGDTDFNEAFATAVGEEGVRRWLARQGDARSRANYETDLRRNNQFVALVMRACEQLKEVYGEEPAQASGAKRAAGLPPAESPGPDRQLQTGGTLANPLVAAKRAAKAEVIARLRADYEQLKASWGGYAGYDDWFKRPINNARLNTIATYYTLVPAFQQLLALDGGDLPRFYTDAKTMAKMTKDQRQEQMAALTNSPARIVATGAR